MNIPPGEEDPVTRTLDFVIADVFIDRPFDGNPPAVFPRLRDLAGEMMHVIALELNLSKTTCVFPPAGANFASTVRIFTPGRSCYSPAMQFARKWDRHGSPRDGTRCSTMSKAAPIGADPSPPAPSPARGRAVAIDRWNRHKCGGALAAPICL